jgi:polyhydroxybutyrate depolymerase
MILFGLIDLAGALWTRRALRVSSLAIVALLILAHQPAIARAAAPVNEAVTETHGGRDMLVTIPAKLPPSGTRALVIVLHGGLGNAARIASSRSEGGLNMDAQAEANGFIVAYLNGTAVTRLGGNMLGWNAGGGCCGLPARNNVDDVAYIKGAVDYLAGKCGIDRGRVFGMGHSNGAMMTQRLMCETNLYVAGVAVSGPLNLDVTMCPASRGKRILAIHGADDANVPVDGGKGTKGISGVAYKSEDFAKRTFTSSGATYTLDVVAGADHQIDRIDAMMRKSEGVTIAQKSVAFFGLAATAAK